MHEMAVVPSILDTVCEFASTADATKVVNLTLHVGAARDIHEPLLQRYFGYFSRDTMAEGVRVSMVTIPVRFRCEECGHIYDYDVTGLRTPHCPAHPDASVDLVSGTELVIEDVGII